MGGSFVLLALAVLAPRVQRFSTPKAASSGPAMSFQGALVVQQESRDADLRGLNWRTLVSMMRSHPWLVPSYLAVVVWLNLLAVSNGDAATASIILAGNGFIGLWNAISLVAVPGAVLAVYLASVVMSGYITGSRGWQAAKPAWWFTLAIGAGALFFNPVLLVLGAGILGGGVALGIRGSSLLWRLVVRVWRLLRGHGWRAEKQGNEPSEAYENYAQFMTLAAIAALVITAFLGDMWLPLERVEVAGQDPIVGYVIAAEDGKLTILEDENRTTITLDAGDVDSRSRCQTEDAFQRWTLFMGKPGSYPSCSVEK